LYRKFRQRWGLTFSLVLFVFAFMMASILFFVILTVVVYLLAGPPPIESYGFDYRDQGGSPGAFMPILGLLFFSIILGTALAAYFGRKALRPLNSVIEATRLVAAGNFATRVDIKGTYELEELGQSFNRMAQELASIETLREDFINSFSHEFKTPIVSIRGFAKLLQDGNLTEAERQEYLSIIIDESERLSGLSTNILNLQKYASMEIISQKTSFRLDEQIRSVVVAAEPLWSAKGIHLGVDLDEVVYEGNEELLQQIWINLLDNAIKFSHPEGAISLRLGASPEAVVFSIEDTGIGMDDQVQARAFDKFYQADSSRSKEGNGLGLAIVKQITELCGGQLEVQSEPEKGSTFTVSLFT